jgi:hypothetical protein
VSTDALFYNSLNITDRKASLESAAWHPNAVNDSATANCTAVTSLRITC